MIENTLGLHFWFGSLSVPPFPSLIMMTPLIERNSHFRPTPLTHERENYETRTINEKISPEKNQIYNSFTLKVNWRLPLYPFFLKL